MSKGAESAAGSKPPQSSSNSSSDSSSADEEDGDAAATAAQANGSSSLKFNEYPSSQTPKMPVLTTLFDDESNNIWKMKLSQKRDFETLKS